MPVTCAAFGIPIAIRYGGHVGTGGFEPPKSKQQIYSLSHLATLVYPLSKKQSRLPESNQRPTDYKSVALPAELKRLF